MTKDKYHIQRVSELKQHSSASFIIEWCAFFVNKTIRCSFLKKRRVSPKTQLQAYTLKHTIS